MEKTTFLDAVRLINQMKIGYLRKISCPCLGWISCSSVFLAGCTSEKAHFEKTVSEKLKLSLSQALPSWVEIVSSDFRPFGKVGRGLFRVETLVIKSAEDRYVLASAKANHELQDQFISGRLRETTSISKLR